jgi:uncharacterized membrane protein YkvA (DUF1232 family)
MKMEWRERARRLRTELYALALAARHPRTPWYAKLAVAGLVIYAVTPVDFVPDVVPVLGLVDDLVFVPLAIAVAIRFVPPAVLEECRAAAIERVAASKLDWRLVVGLWALLAALGIALAV